jgi:hypothetical protein
MVGRDRAGCAPPDMRTGRASRSLSQLLHALEESRQGLARQRHTLADSVAALRSQTLELVASAARLNRTRLDLQAGDPPVSLLLDNVRHLVFRRAFRQKHERPPRAPVLLFYGDVAAIFGPHRKLSLTEWYRRIHSQDRAAYRAAERGRERCAQGYTIEYRYNMIPRQAGVCLTATSSISPNRNARRKSLKTRPNTSGVSTATVALFS